jgi:RNA polymerase sigma-70 factor, ECF subfamily
MPVELISAIKETNATSSSADCLIADEDALLVAAAKANDTRAFELLVERHERKIFSMAQLITRNREDAEDVVQQSFQKSFIHLKKFEGEESSSNTETALPPDFLDSGPHPEDSCLDREQEQLQSVALKKLRPGTRKAIELRELGELSTGETALVMGLSVAAVKGRVFHGRKKLRETLRQGAISVPRGRTETRSCERAVTRTAARAIDLSAARVIRAETEQTRIVAFLLAASPGRS